MKQGLKILFFFYQWLIAFPLLLVLTIVTALATILLSPLFPNKRFSYFPARWWGRAFCYLLFIKVKLIGLEKLNAQQSYVIVCNHQSIYDVFVVYGWLPMIFKWLMKAELRKIPLVGKACADAGHIFIDRSNAVTAKHSIEQAEKQLKNGNSVVIFPEGTRTHNGEMCKFKRGAFLIATDLHLPILPLTLRGCYERLPRNTVNVVPGTIEIIIHQPVDVNSYGADGTPKLIQDSWNIINSAL